MILKLIFNLLLIPIESIGINGAVISSIISHIVSFLICFTALKRNIDIKFKLSKFVIKPLIAIINMGIFSSFIYNIFLYDFLLQKHISFLLTLIMGFLIYFLSIIVLKIFSFEEFFMLPYGQKLYKMLVKLKLYEPHETQ